MYTPLYWIEGPWAGRLAVSPRPRGGDWLRDEIINWQKSGVDVVVSLLAGEEIQDLALENEAFECKEADIQFISFPIVDRSVPVSEGRAVNLIERLDAELQTGRTVVVHCRQGVGRSGLIAASLLAARGAHPASAMKQISAVRGAVVPETREQENWIATFASNRVSP